MPQDYGLRYCAEGGKPYYHLVPDTNEWINVDKADAKDYLGIEKGVDPLLSKNQAFSAIDRAMLEIRKYFHVQSAGYYAGYLKAGDYRIGNNKVLILRDVALPPMVQGNCDLIDEFISLAFPEPDQATVMHSWLSWAFLSLRTKPEGQWDHGQALVFIGDPGKGKTAWQGIITRMLTGRSCDPSMYMSDRTTFNEDTGISEHWCLSDPRAKNSKDTSFLGELKKAVANVEAPYHAKGKTLITIPTYRRLTISLNKDNESLQILQGMAASDLDKIIALDFEPPGWLEPNHPNGFKYQEWFRHLTSEIPAYVYRGMNSCVIPPHLAHSRYGVAYHNPTIEPAISATTAGDRDIQIAEVVLKGLTYSYDGGSTNISTGDLYDKIHKFESPVKERARTYTELSSPDLIGKLLLRWLNKYNGQMSGFAFTTVLHPGMPDNYTFEAYPTGRP